MCPPPPHLPIPLTHTTPPSLVINILSISRESCLLFLLLFIVCHVEWMMNNNLYLFVKKSMQYIMTGNSAEEVWDEMRGTNCLYWTSSDLLSIVCCQLWVRWGKKIDNHIIMIEMTTHKKNSMLNFPRKDPTCARSEVCSAQSTRYCSFAPLFAIYIFAVWSFGAAKHI